MTFRKSMAAGIILFCATDNTFLMGWRSDGGGYAFPGGHMNKSDKDTLDTAVRELKEELGVDLTLNELINKVEYKATTLVKYDKYDRKGNKLDTMCGFSDIYLCIVRNKHSVIVSSPGDGELTHPRWMTVQDIIEHKKVYPPSLISLNVVLPGLLSKCKEDLV